MDSYETELESRLDSIERECTHFADEVITTVCKRAIRQMNTWPRDTACVCDEYPSGFKFFDILSIELQSNYYCDISPLLEDAVENALWNEYKDLSAQEKFFIYNMECSTKDILDDNDIQRLLNDRFRELLNEHWQLKKIQNFEEHRTW